MSNTRSIAFVALTIAIMAVSAWVTVPIGPIPVTLQMFAFTFAIVVLAPKECMAAVAGYLVLGAIGVPVFSGMRGGIGVLMGPTGGFLWGYIFGAAAGVALLYFYRKKVGESALLQPAPKLKKDGDAFASQKAIAFLRSSGVELLAGILFTWVAYACGWAQYQVVASASPLQAFMVCIAPFILLDLAKIIAAVVVANAVKKAVGR